MTSDDLLTATALRLARAVRDCACEFGPILSAVSTWSVLSVMGAPAWAAGMGCVFVLTVTGAILWSRTRLDAAAVSRQSRRAQRAVLDLWPTTATAAGLVTYDDRLPDVEHIERRGAGLGGVVLDLHLRLPPGLTADDVEAASARLAVALGAARVEVEADPLAAAKLVLRVVLDDPLAAPASEPSPLLAAGAPWHPRSHVPLGRLGDGSLLAPQLLGQHWLIAGMTGTGKSTTAQSVATFLTLCSPGTAQAVVLDPKGGAEFGWLGQSGVASEVVGPDVEEACRALSGVVEVMHDRQAKCAAAGRRETEPAIVSPLVVILIDEAAAYRRDKKHRDEFDRLLTLLAEQGRSSAISIVLLPRLQV